MSKSVVLLDPDTLVLSPSGRREREEGLLNGFVAVAIMRSVIAATRFLCALVEFPSDVCISSAASMELEGGGGAFVCELEDDDGGIMP